MLLHKTHFVHYIWWCGYETDTQKKPYYAVDRNEWMKKNVKFTHSLGVKRCTITTKKTLFYFWILNYTRLFTSWAALKNRESSFAIVNSSSLAIQNRENILHYLYNIKRLVWKTSLRFSCFAWKKKSEKKKLFNYFFIFRMNFCPLV